MLQTLHRTAHSLQLWPDALAHERVLSLTVALLTAWWSCTLSVQSQISCPAQFSAQITQPALAERQLCAQAAKLVDLAEAFNLDADHLRTIHQLILPSDDGSTSIFNVRTGLKAAQHCSRILWLGSLSCHASQSHCKCVTQSISASLTSSSCLLTVAAPPYVTRAAPSGPDKWGFALLLSRIQGARQ